MSHIFISYSSRDLVQAEALHEALEQAGYLVWRDKTNIRKEWPEEIAGALNNASAVVVLLSKNALNSDWVKKELKYSVSNHIAVILLGLDGFYFDNIPNTEDDTFQFLIGDHQINSSIRELLKLLPRIGVRPHIPDVGLSSSPMVNVANKTYKIGDIYDDGRKRGVVFEITPDGKHGKIVSLEQKELLWLNSNEMIRGSVGTLSKSKGKDNLITIQKYSGWQSKYPAFAWCANLGEDWYLPAIDEFKTFVKNDGSVRKLVNITLSKLQEYEIDEDGYYWSSTESGQFRALQYKLDTYSSSPEDKQEYHLVRAFSEF